LYQNGFLKGYWYWKCHGETEPTECDKLGNSNSQNLYEHTLITLNHFWIVLEQW